MSSLRLRLFMAVRSAIGISGGPNRTLGFASQKLSHYWLKPISEPPTFHAPVTKGETKGFFMEAGRKNHGSAETIH